MSAELNHLQHEHSPYLLQHAANPVDWYPWSEEALNRAKSENKLLVISIGYSACHWCHVMEHESFEDGEVARVMNKYYVSVKVDREERPDIDQVYMDAAFLITGRGGWPLNVVALPGGEPVFAGTYFRKQDWLYILQNIADAYAENPETLERDARNVGRELQNFDFRPELADQDFPDLTRVFEVWKRYLDRRNGGSAGAPKFPMPVNLSALLRLGVMKQNKEALQAVELTLDKMAAGGIYDQLGGGFCRYSTDDHWHIPHFEKMLYDNAQLIEVYSEAYKYFRKPRYRQVVEETLAFIERELTAPGGLFYSSLDADSEGHEGKFYVWTSREIQEILGEQAGRIMEYYGIVPGGNWENNQNILFTGVYDQEEDPEIRKLKSVLLKERSKRIRPGLDSKILVSWNALMISGLVAAAMALENSIYADLAVRAGINLEKYHKPEGGILHSGGDGQRKINGFLEDYALTIAAFTDLYQFTFDLKWLEKAEILMKYAIEHFSHPGDPLFYFTSSADAKLISRKTDTGDNVIPSSNAVMARNLLILGHLLDREEYTGRSEQMVRHMSLQIMENPVHHALWTSVALQIKESPADLSIIGKNWKILHREIGKKYLPNVILSGGETGESLSILEGKEVKDQTVMYVCRNKTCSLPITDIDDLKL